jgi:hypothetical protein
MPRKKLAFADVDLVARRMGPDDALNPAAAPGWDRDTLLAVIRTYQAGRRAGLQEIEIDKRVITAFMDLHPEVPRVTVGEIVAHVIAWASREHGAWFWKGCERPYVDPRREPVFDPVKGYLVPGPPPLGSLI